jgi:anti-sigma-K factor RskA
MTDGPRERRPADVAALAELDADLPDEVRAARGRAAVAHDPDAAAVLDALAATRADLAALPTPDVPVEVAARWSAALAAEHTHRSPVDRGRARRIGRPAWRPLLAAAAITAVVVGAGLGALVHRPEPSAPAVTGVELVALGRAAVGTMDVGGLADPVRRGACLRAVAPVAADERLLGGRQVVLDGRPGVLLVLATGSRGGLRIVTVDPGCGPEGGTLLTQLVVA